MIALFVATTFVGAEKGAEKITYEGVEYTTPSDGSYYVVPGTNIVKDQNGNWCPKKDFIGWWTNTCGNVPLVSSWTDFQTSFPKYATPEKIKEGETVTTVIMGQGNTVGNKYMDPEGMWCFASDKGYFDEVCPENKSFASYDKIVDHEKGESHEDNKVVPDENNPDENKGNDKVLPEDHQTSEDVNDDNNNEQHEQHVDGEPNGGNNGDGSLTAPSRTIGFGFATAFVTVLSMI